MLVERQRERGKIRDNYSLQVSFGFQEDGGLFFSLFSSKFKDAILMTGLFKFWKMCWEDSSRPWQNKMGPELTFENVYYFKIIKL